MRILLFVFALQFHLLPSAPRADEAGEESTMNVTDTITVAEIEQGIPESIRPFLAIDAVPIPRSSHSIIEAFWEATKRIEKIIRIRRRTNIILAKAPFIVNLSIGQLVYTPKNKDVINVHVEDIIFLDIEKMLPYRFQIQVACILEEFAHALMNVSDEAVVMHVVALIYDGVRVINGKYYAVESSK